MMERLAYAAEIYTNLRLAEEERELEVPVESRDKTYTRFKMSISAS